MRHSTAASFSPAISRVTVVSRSGAAANRSARWRTIASRPRSTPVGTSSSTPSSCQPAETAWRSWFAIASKWLRTCVSTALRLVMRLRAGALAGLAASASFCLVSVSATAGGNLPVSTQGTRQIGDGPSHFGGTALPSGTHDPAAHDHAVGEVGDVARLLRGGDAEPHGHRQVGRGADAGDGVDELRRDLVALAGGAGDRHRV